MKKLVSVAVVGIMSLMLLTGCGVKKYTDYFVDVGCSEKSPSTVNKNIESDEIPENGFSGYYYTKDGDDIEEFAEAFKYAKLDEDDIKELTTYYHHSEHSEFIFCAVKFDSSKDAEKYYKKFINEIEDTKEACVDESKAHYVEGDDSTTLSIKYEHSRISEDTMLYQQINEATYIDGSVVIFFYSNNISENYSGTTQSVYQLCNYYSLDIPR